jgi:DNA polymerase III subunit alpha
VDLFGGGAVTPPASAADAPEWTDAERLAAEREALGLYLSGHPIAPYRAELEELTDVALASLAQAEGRRVCIAGLLVGMRVRAKARRTHFLTFDDGRARVEVTVFERLHEQCRDLLARDSVLVVEGEVSADEYTGGHKLIAERIEALPAARERRGAVLQVVLARDVPAGALDTLRDLLAAYAGGGVPVWLRCGARARGWFVLGPVHRVRPEDALVQRLAMLPGIEAVRFRYGMPAAAAAGMSARAAAA